jgi:hypothetical protein
MHKKTGILFGATLMIWAATASAYVSKTTSTISLAVRDNLIVATTITDWDTRASDVLAVSWIAPKGSFCKNSQFVLSRGNDVADDESWAYRTVIHGNVVCSGDWTARVVNVNTHQVLASAGYTISSTPVSSS